MAVAFEPLAAQGIADIRSISIGGALFDLRPSPPSSREGRQGRWRPSTRSWPKSASCGLPGPQDRKGKVSLGEGTIGVRSSFIRRHPFRSGRNSNRPGMSSSFAALRQDSPGSLTASGRVLPVMDLRARSPTSMSGAGGFWPELAGQGYSGKFSTTFSARGHGPVTLEGDLAAPGARSTASTRTFPPDLHRRHPK